ncbi:MAG: leishmanolysin-related zinc metalloendopeptidase [Gemmatales bacterium]
MSPPSIRLLLETLEDRLTPSWAAIPSLTQALPKLFTNVSLNSLGSSNGTGAISTGEVDWYRFTATKTGTYTISATTPSSNLNTVAALYSTEGLRLAYNNDAGTGNTDSSFNINLVLGRSYYLGVTNFTGTSRGDYLWKVLGPPVPDDAYEKNDTFSAAAYLGILTTSKVLSPLALTDNSDWYSFTTTNVGTAANQVSINFPSALGQLNLDLFNSNGVQIAAGVPNGDDESVSLNGFLGASYYVHVSAPDGVIIPSYTLTINPPPPPDPTPYKITLQLTGFSASQVLIFQQAAARWESIITAGLPIMNYQGTLTNGVVINGKSEPIDGVGNILGHGGPDQFRPGTHLPFHGTMAYDTADIAAMEKDGTLKSVILHEMAHVLGLGTIWTDKGLLAGAGTTDPRFTGARATFEYNRIFSRAENSVPVENVGGPGTVDAHWRETVFFNELMTGYIQGSVNPLSRITLGSFIDLGYSIDMTKADTYTKPKGAALQSGTGTGNSASLIAPFLAGSPSFTPAPQQSSLQMISLELAKHTTSNDTVDAPKVELAPNKTLEKSSPDALSDLVFTFIKTRL